jgi:hypothetical protein
MMRGLVVVMAQVRVLIMIMIMGEVAASGFLKLLFQAKDYECST